MLNPGIQWDFILAFTVVLSMMPVLIHFAPRLGLMGHPDEQNDHAGTVPLVGGIAIFLGLLLVLSIRHFDLPGVKELLLAGLILVVAGGADDRSGVSPKVRFVIVIIASVLMIYGAGVLLIDFGFLLGNFIANLGWFGVPVTIFCVIGVTQATKMTDGMDGLSGCLLLVALTALQLAIWQNFSFEVIPEIPVLAGAICAFLLFNLRLPWRNNALAFLGHGGSLLAGFVLAWFLVELSQGAERVITPVTALWLFAVPVLDTAFLLIRSKILGRPMVETDHQHLHHAFLRSGRSINETLRILVLAAIACAGFGLMLELYQVPEYISFYAFLAISGLFYFAMSRVWKSKRLFGREIV